MGITGQYISLGRNDSGWVSLYLLLLVLMESSDNSMKSK